MSWRNQVQNNSDVKIMENAVKPIKLNFSFQLKIPNNIVEKVTIGSIETKTESENTFEKN